MCFIRQHRGDCGGYPGDKYNTVVFLSSPDYEPNRGRVLCKHGSYNHELWPEYVRVFVFCVVVLGCSKVLIYVSLHLEESFFRYPRSKDTWCSNPGVLILLSTFSTQTCGGKRGLRIHVFLLLGHGIIFPIWRPIEVVW